MNADWRRALRFAAEFTVAMLLLLVVVLFTLLMLLVYGIVGPLANGGR